MHEHQEIGCFLFVLREFGDSEAVCLHIEPARHRTGTKLGEAHNADMLFSAHIINPLDCLAVGSQAEGSFTLVKRLTPLEEIQRHSLWVGAALLTQFSHLLKPFFILRFGKGTWLGSHTDKIAHGVMLGSSK